GGIDCFFDLSEDPAREYDLAGSTAPSGGMKTLFKMGFNAPLASTWFHPDDNHADTAQASWAGSPPRLHLLEATSTRVKVRQESFFQELNNSAVLPGIKILGDYTVYPAGKMALRWNRRTTKAVTYNTQSMEISARLVNAPDPRANITRCTDTDCD